MVRSPLEVADIFRSFGADYRRKHRGRLSAVQLRAMRAIEQCRTAALGGHLEQCDECGHQRNAYNSCRNRNCPKCQSTAAKRWLAKRESELLPVPYFHVVFTVPQEIAEISLANRKAFYRILFRCVSRSLLQIATDRKYMAGQIGFLAILHTWGQNLDYHPHIHCVVAGGALQQKQRWVGSRKKFFLPVRVLSALFRGKLLAALNRAFREGTFRFTGTLASLNEKREFGAFLSIAAKKKWVTYCKPPFGEPQQVLKYLSRYTHRIAISNHRLIRFQDREVTFRWRDYRDHGRTKRMTLDVFEFIRRFLLHIVPARFVRIRHYGFLANRNRSAALALIRSQFKAEPACTETTPATESTTEDDPLPLCPVCKEGSLHRIAILVPVPIQDSS